MKIHMDFFDPNTGTFSNPGIQQGFGGGAFNVNTKRPFYHKGQSYVSLPVGLDKETGEPIYKNVKTNMVPGLKEHATLMRDEWIEIDTAVQMIARERLMGIADLRSRGLVYNLNNPMGKTVLEYQDMNDPGSAHMDMDALHRGENDAPDYLTKYLPIPIIYSDFTLAQRQLDASRSSGDALDTTMVEACTRRVMEQAEDLLFTDTSFTYGGGTIYSYVSSPTSNSVTLTVNWDASGKTGAQIKDDVLAMIQASITANHYGPFVLYIPQAYQTVMGDDYASGYPKTIRERLMEIQEISDIKVADRLAANTVLLVEMSTATVRLVEGFMPTVLQWTGNGGLSHHFKVMAILVPQIRADQAGNSGLTVLSA